MNTGIYNNDIIKVFDHMNMLRTAEHNFRQDSFYSSTCGHTHLLPHSRMHVLLVQEYGMSLTNTRILHENY